MLMAHLTATRSTCDRGPELLFDPGRHGVGAVLVKDKRCIAGGYNGSAPGDVHCCDPETFRECKTCGGRVSLYADSDSPAMLSICADGCGHTLQEKHGGHLMRDGHCVRTIHSEMNALMQCALDGTPPQGATLYTTASPCFDCAKSIIRSGIVKVYYGQPYDSRYGLSSDVRDMLMRAGLEVEQLIVTRQELGEQSA
jgi:dCMP deaminase